jgi:hypothetical protein
MDYGPDHASAGGVHIVIAARSRRASLNVPGEPAADRSLVSGIAEVSPPEKRAAKRA